MAEPKVDPNKLRDNLIQKFEQRTQDLKENTDYYESERRPDAVGVSVPRKMEEFLAKVGYPRTYVNSIADRLAVEGFRLGGADKADETLWDWWQANDLDVESTLGHTDALVHGRSYVTVAAPDPKVDLDVDPTVPIIRVEPPTSLYADIDQRTRKVTQAIRVTYGEDGSEVIAATLYLPENTMSWTREKGEFKLTGNIRHGMMLVPVVPLANRTRLSDLHGTSEITPELRSVTDAASRIMMDMQVTAELMAVPQRLIFGVKAEDLGIDSETGQTLFDAYIARILAFEESDGRAEQFLAAELRNFTEALDHLDKKAAQYTGLPPQYLATQSDNPASAEAIRASESRLVMAAEHKALIFGGAWEQVMRVAHKVMNPGGPIPPDMFRMEAKWRDPSTPTYAAKADAAAKLYANGMGVIPRERARIDIGYTEIERLEMQKWDKEEDAMAQLAGMYGEQPGTASSSPAASKEPAE